MVLMADYRLGTLVWTSFTCKRSHHLAKARRELTLLGGLAFSGSLLVTVRVSLCAYFVHVPWRMA